MAIEKNMNAAREAGVIQLTLENDRVDGRLIKINNRQCVNFASCSYLGLELDPRLIEAIVTASQKYGSQFSASRAYLSITPYRTAEMRFTQICKRPVIIGPSTTLIHQSAIPVLVDDEDAVILDQQVHNSVAAACRALVVRKVHMEINAHNHMERLDRQINRLKKDHKKIWYLMDGLYSMAGDFAPVDQLALLLNRHEQLHIYADDAHGASWQGRHGEGLILSRLGDNSRVTVALSLNKSFAGAGGLLAVADEAVKQAIRNLGETLTFSGPIQPPMLGAVCASADIHLSNELADHQRKLREKIQYFNDLCINKGLHLVDHSVSPIRFIQIGVNEDTIGLARELVNRGYYVCTAGFPSVAKNKSGIRMTITNHITEEDMQMLVEEIASLVGMRASQEQILEEAAETI